ncbi:UDP-glycosyltransferase [Trifolium repens]|nr:UDP-glycosyltransferase [Trifolium repens]
MESQAPQLHFVLFPLMSPGHMLPMIDLAKTLTQQNIIVTIVTTPHNASRFSETFSQTHSGHKIRLLQLQFPSQDAGFPEGCENFDMLPSMSMAFTFFYVANTLLQEQAEKAFEKLTPKPNCIISDVSFPYTSQIATKYKIPRISFYGVSCFCLVWQQKLILSNVMEKIATDSEYFLIPEIPHKIEITKAQTPSSNDGNWQEFVDKMTAAEMVSYGVVVNSFEELEPEYVSDLKKTRNGKVWCVGPVSLRNKNQLDMAQRGNTKVATSIVVENCLKWLDLQNPNSVIYVGVMVGVESPSNWGEEENVGVLVKKEDVERAIEKLMDNKNCENEERRKRAKELAEMAKRGVEEGGSSHFNVTLLIQDILQQSTK